MPNSSTLIANHKEDKNIVIHAKMCGGRKKKTPMTKTI
jgi:hypothetical protein